MANGENQGGYLGLDIGPNSIGWALLKPDEHGEIKIAGSGVRIFQGGLEDIKTDGRGKSRNVTRREARSRRRMIERRSRRLTNLAIHLQKLSLLPAEYDLELSSERNDLFEKLDNDLRNPYELRAIALDNKLSPFELGRVIYHLAQRRGFLSNRRTDTKDEKETGKVKEGISNLYKEIEDSGSRTLGEHFFKLINKNTRVRGRYTSRKMYQYEFNLIWEKQRKYSPDLLTNERKDKIQNQIFYQRKLKAPIIGECQLEPGRTRAPKSLLISQQFRYLQTINNIRISSIENPGGRELTKEEREFLIKKLDSQGSMTFNKIRQVLKLDKESKINLESGKDTKILGNTTAAKIIAVFGADSWNSFHAEDKNRIIEDLRSIEKYETAKRRAMRKWGLDDDSADKFSKIKLEDGYLQFSRHAIERLLPLLSKGINLQTAIK
ncbi:MAG: hypothetical protein GF353_01125, partial [Candidatus Lokiarchaeota archaeon]|nr:hypothetical protein [Candidatus Lokiarchaeota archaeon]